MRSLATEHPAESRWEERLLLLLGLCVPFSAYPLFDWHGFPVDAAHCAAGALVLFAAARTLAGRRLPPDRRLVLAAAALVLLPLGALLREPRALFAAASFWKTWTHLVFMVAVFLCVASIPAGARSFHRLLLRLVLFAALLAAYGWYQVWGYERHVWSGVDFLNGLASHPLRLQMADMSRPTSVFAEPAWLADFLLSGVVFAYALFLRDEEGRLRRDRTRSGLALTALLLAGIFFTFSLAGILLGYLLVSLLVLDAFRHLSRRRAWLLAATLGTVALLFAGLVAFGDGKMPARTRERVARQFQALSRFDVLGRNRAAISPDAEDTSSVAHVQNARNALLAWRSSPVVGIGLGQFPAVAAPGDPSSDYVTGLQWVAETGIAGSAAFLLLLLALWRGLAGRPALSSSLSRIAGLLAVVFVLKQAHQASYITLSSWYPLGLAALAATLAARRPRELSVAGAALDPRASEQRSARRESRRETR